MILSLKKRKKKRIHLQKMTLRMMTIITMMKTDMIQMPMIMNPKKIMMKTKRKKMNMNSDQMIQMSIMTLTRMI